MQLTADGNAVIDDDGKVYHPKPGESVETLLARLIHSEQDAVMRAPLRGGNPLKPEQLPGCFPE